MRSLIAILLFSITFLNCSKEVELSPADQLVKDKQIIEEYLINHNLTAQNTASGLYYILEQTGNGSSPNINSTVKVKYKGYLTNDVVFDKTTGNEVVEFKLKEVIKGWQEAIPFMKIGGKGKFLIPSQYCYAGNSQGSIPKNAVLIFDIDLIDFTN